MITLKTLHLATAQEVFDQVKTHLLTQMERADDFTSCKYRSHKGLKCAAGCLIADDEYREEMESIPWIVLVMDGDVPDSHDRLIRELQVVHDTFHPYEWKEQLEKVAKENNLEWNE